MEERDRGLLRELVSGSLREGHALMALRAAMVERPPRGREAVAAELILVGLHQLRSMRIPAHAAVSATVAACGPLGLGRSRGLINAVLRRYQRERERLEAEIEDLPRVRHELPDWLCDSLAEAWPDRWMQIAEAMRAHPSFWLRVNRRRTELETLIQRLEAAGASVERSEEAPERLRLVEAMERAALPGHEEGQVSIQDAGAQRAARWLDLADGQRVLDACAAPGGKTGHILELADVALTAVDSDQERLQRVTTELERLGGRAELLCADAADTDAWWDGTPFDRILLDAPCSATGVIGRHPDIRFHRRAEDLGPLCETQSRLMDALWTTLAPGGGLLYVTCSVLPQECGEQVSAFLERTADAAIVPLHPELDAEAAGGRYRLPGAGEDGFYYAYLRKALPREATDQP